MAGHSVRDTILKSQLRFKSIPTKKEKRLSREMGMSIRGSAVGRVKMQHNMDGSEDCIRRSDQV